MKSIFYVEDIFIVRQIIVKNASGSNNYIFFSIVDRKVRLMFFGFGQCIWDDEYIFIYRKALYIRINSEIIRKYNDKTWNNFNICIQILCSSFSVQVVRFISVRNFHTNLIVLSHFWKISFERVIISFCNKVSFDMFLYNLKKWNVACMVIKLNRIFISYLELFLGSNI